MCCHVLAQLVMLQELLHGGTMRGHTQLRTQILAQTVIQQRTQVFRFTAGNKDED